MLLLLILTSNVLLADEYVVPSSVLKARDESVKSLERFKNTILTRYFLLKSKKNRTLAEDREMTGLNAIIYNEDLSKTETILNNLYKPNNDFKIQGLSNDD